MSDVKSPDQNPVVREIAPQLERLGVTASYEYKAWPQNVNGNAIEGGTRAYTLTLPHPTNVEAKFVPRALTEEIIEIFKHRVTTGDAAFDDAIHVSTTTPDETRALLLRLPALRAFVRAEVSVLRPLEIDGRTVTVRFRGNAVEIGPRILALVEMLTA